MQAGPGGPRGGGAQTGDQPWGAALRTVLYTGTQGGSCSHQYLTAGAVLRLLTSYSSSLAPGRQEHSRSIRCVDGGACGMAISRPDTDGTVTSSERLPETGWRLVPRQACLPSLRSIPRASSRRRNQFQEASRHQPVTWPPTARWAFPCVV